MKFEFPRVRPHKIWSEASLPEWKDWRWQMRASLKSEGDFSKVFELSASEKEGLREAGKSFRTLVTPYYASLASVQNEHDPIRMTFIPKREELAQGQQQMVDPLGEFKNQVGPRLIHRYSDRVLFWVTDFCGIYCRYCLRKHFTAQGHALMSNSDYRQALDYIGSHTGIREVILSGGDPLTVSDEILDQTLEDLRKISHVEIIRIGTRMPVVNPMRVTEDLARLLRRHQPVFVMSHFNHPREVTADSYEALGRLVDHGIPVFNQMVLLNGVNNHPVVVQALSRRLLYCRVKPYYMFQCDPSMGTDHLRTTVQSSLDIQRELWGHLSGLAMPNLSLDIPQGGGKVGLVPNFLVSQNDGTRKFKGWDGVEADYIDPRPETQRLPIDFEVYAEEWARLKDARAART